LLDRDESVDQDGVPLAVDEGRRYRRPHSLFRTRGQVADGRAYAGCHEHLPLQRPIHITASAQSCFAHARLRVDFALHALDLGETAIYKQFRSRDVAAVVGREK